MTLGCHFLFKKRWILFKSPSLGLSHLTKYIKSTLFGAEPGGLCPIVDFRGSLAALVLVLRPRPPCHLVPHPLHRLSPCPLHHLFPCPLCHLSPCPSPRPLCHPSLHPLCRHYPPCLVVVGFNSQSWGSFIRRGSCYLVVMLSSIVLSWWSHCRSGLLCQLYCHGRGWVVIVVVGLSLSWLGCRCHGWVVLVVVMLWWWWWLHGRRHGVMALVMHTFGLAVHHSTHLVLPRRCVIHGWGFAVAVRHASIILPMSWRLSYAGVECQSPHVR